MSHRRHPVRPRITEFVVEQHVWIRRAGIKDAWRILLETDRRYRAKRFPLLDFVQLGLHRGILRRCKNAAISQGAWAKFRAAIQEYDGLVGGRQQVCQLLWG